MADNEKLVTIYLNDRQLTKEMVKATFIRDKVPEELITEYFKCYDRETKIGTQIAEWLDANREQKQKEEKDAT